MKAFKQITLLISFVFASIVAFGQTINISVEVTDIRSNEGTILVGLFDSKKNFLKTPLKGKKVKAQKGSIKVVFEEVSIGNYTVSVIHDKNNNNKLDTNFIGIPNEPYGISKDGKNMFGPPSYQKAVFEVSDKDINLSISL